MRFNFIIPIWNTLVSFSVICVRTNIKSVDKIKRGEEEGEKEKGKKVKQNKKEKKT